MSAIAEKVSAILRSVPAEVTVVAVCKGRSALSVMEAVEAGIRLLGQNYIADARRVGPAVRGQAAMHFTGRLRVRDVRASSLSLFDMIQSVDSLEAAVRIDRVCSVMGN